ncbi:MAG: hypothetical protein C0418_05365 [Coriobacteriaceae bacterium]|nr:hypothetical protein [Coriobacteriaceae bacterium]
MLYASNADEEARVRNSAGKPIAGISVLAVTAIAIGAAMLAAAGVWYLQYQQVTQLRARLSASETRAQLLATQLDEAKDALRTATEGSASGATSAPVAEEDAEEPPEVAKQFCFIKDLTEAGGTYSLVLDYAQMLSGKAAADAAAARGEESPPPNDYFIVNDNPKLRTLQAASGAKVTLYYDGMAEKRSMTIAQFATIFAANRDGKADVPYYAVVSEDEVLSLEEQYLP